MAKVYNSKDTIATFKEHEMLKSRNVLSLDENDDVEKNSHKNDIITKLNYVQSRGKPRILLDKMTNVNLIIKPMNKKPKVSYFIFVTN